MTNPLLAHGTLPAFDRITAAHVEPAIRQHLATFNAGLEQLERDARPTWDGSVAATTALAEPLGWAWSVVNHLMGVRNSPELRAAHAAVQGDVVAAFLRLGQCAALYRAEKAIDQASLDAVQRRVVVSAVKEMELAGVALEGAAKERFTAIERDLAELATTYENQLIDATKAWSMRLTAAADLDGLPSSLIGALTARATAAWESGGKQGPEPTVGDGPWLVTLDYPVAGPFLEHSRRRDLRERLYRAMIAKASGGGGNPRLDNGPVLERILALRQEKARLLGYHSFAEVSLATKMAPGVAAVERLLSELHVAARPKAEAELAELRAYAIAHGHSGDLALWDIVFWAERLREETYSYTDEELRPYFSLPRVLDGLFATARRLFGITVRPADGETPVWNPDVRFFRIADESGRDIAAFYLDPYVRPADKRGGAWMDVCLSRKRLPDGSLRLPVAYLVCNQTPPVGDTPSLMTFREVETLFHEFGHGLQHMLTTIDHVEAAGISNVEWDAVELPSQFMENWCYDPATVLGDNGLAKHWQTGAPLPTATFERICAARIYRAGSMTMRQIYFSQVDVDLHHRYVPGGAITALDVQRAVARTHTILPPLPEDRSLCSFSHIFAGGYAAGYYSYKWAEVLAADAFAAFTDAGLADGPAITAIGRRFRDTVLSLGGGAHPLDVFKRFRGREPSTAALIEQTGLR